MQKKLLGLCSYLRVNGLENMDTNHREAGADDLGSLFFQSSNSLG